MRTEQRDRRRLHGRRALETTGGERVEGFRAQTRAEAKGGPSAFAANGAGGADGMSTAEDDECARREVAAAHPCHIFLETSGEEMRADVITEMDGRRCEAGVRV